MKEEPNTLVKSILYRAHYRGGKEADTILGGFAKAKIQELPEAERADFATLLTFDDVVIFSWLDGLPFESVTLLESLRDKIVAFRDSLGR